MREDQHELQLERPSIPFEFNDGLSDREHLEYLAMINNDPMTMRGFHLIDAELKLQSAPPQNSGFLGSIINMLSFGCVSYCS